MHTASFNALNGIWLYLLLSIYPSRHCQIFTKIKNAEMRKNASSHNVLISYLCKAWRKSFWLKKGICNKYLKKKSSKYLCEKYQWMVNDYWKVLNDNWLRLHFFLFSSLNFKLLIFLFFVVDWHATSCAC